LPNTVTAKVNFTWLERLPVGAILLLAALLYSGLFVMLIVGLAGLGLEPRRVRLAGFFIFIYWLAYYVYIGGDVYFERHLVGLFALAAAFSAALWGRASALARGLLALALAMGIALSVTRDMGRFDYFNPKVNDPYVMLGQAVAEDREHYGVLIVDAAGKVPFYAGGDCIDSLGLNDPYLATINRLEFIPGHSAGSGAAAIEIARQHPSGVYSTLSFLDLDIIHGPEAVSLWMDNRHPQEEVQRAVSQEQWEAALATGDPYIWSIISQPILVTGQSP